MPHSRSIADLKVHLCLPDPPVTCFLRNTLLCVHPSRPVESSSPLLLLITLVPTSVEDSRCFLGPYFAHENGGPLDDSGRATKAAN